MSEVFAGQMLAHGTMFGLGLVMQIAFFVVAITSVRRANRDASTLMISASVLHFFGTLASPVVTLLVSRAYGVEDMLRLNTITMVTFGLLSLAASSLLLVGIARLAEGRPRE